MVRWSTWIMGFVAFVCVPAEAAAGWYFNLIPPGDGPLRVMGPYATEEDCDADAFEYEADESLPDTVADCYYKDDAVDSGSGDDDGGDRTGDSDRPARDDRGRHELRVYTAARLPAFGRSIKTGLTMAGFTPDMLAAGATADAGLSFGVRFSWRRWSSGYLEGGYVRDGFSYMGTALGTLNGGYVQGGYQHAFATSGRCGGQLSFGYGLRFSSFSASDANTELADQRLESVHLIADTRLLLSCRLTNGGMWLDTGLGAFYSPYRFQDPVVGDGDPNLYIEMPSFGASAGLGVTFVL
jgi:hypothetical protein